MLTTTKLCSVLVFVSTLAIAVHGGSRFRRNTEDDINKNIDEAGKEINGFFKSIWGGTCVTNDQCLAPPVIAYCDKKEGVVGSITGGFGDGECRPSIYLWLIIAAIAFLMLVSCICCLCCTCCSCILDCLCCCCRNKGYSPAGTG